MQQVFQFQTFKCFNPGIYSAGSIESITAHHYSKLSTRWPENLATGRVTVKIPSSYYFSAKGTLIDQMITMIDEYSANLEEIVSERTKELEEMQEKTEVLLYRMMPKLVYQSLGYIEFRSIANSLRDGLPVRPQLHGAVSLLVCDICRFTALCESCIPEHVSFILIWDCE